MLVGLECLELSKGAYSAYWPLSDLQLLHGNVLYQADGGPGINPLSQNSQIESLLLISLIVDLVSREPWVVMEILIHAATPSLVWWADP